MCGSAVESHKILGRRLNNPQGLRPQRKLGISTTIMQCTICNLIHANPLPIPNSLQDHYKVDVENYWKPGYFDFTMETGYFKKELESFENLYGVSPKGKKLRALDVGSGIGKCMTVLSHNGFDAFGVEPSESFYNIAVDKGGYSKDRIQLSKVEDAEFEESFFDFITFGAVLEHFYDPSTALLKALKWIKPNGLIHVEVPHAHWLVNKMVNTFYKISGSDYVANLSPMHTPYHLYEFSSKSFEVHGKKNGYEVVHEEFYVCQTYMPRFLDPLIRGIMEATKTGMILKVWLRKSQ